MPPSMAGRACAGSLTPLPPGAVSRGQHLLIIRGVTWLGDGDLWGMRCDLLSHPDAQMALGCPTVAGNHERDLLEGSDASPSVAFARPFLSAAHLQWIGTMPKALFLAGGEVFACHGSPAGGDLSRDSLAGQR